jgi:cytidylate kinase
LQQYDLFSIVYISHPINNGRYYGTDISGVFQLIIAIDGPAGSGKSTVAKMLAKHLGFKYLDTGAMYRAITWKALKMGIDLEDENALCRLAEQTTIEFQGESDVPKIFVDSADVTEEIRQSFVTNNVHYISNKQGVRKYMVKLQQKIAAEGNTVAEGRDMGTVVFPQAEKKFFLDAEIGTRSQRRYKQFKPSDEKVTYYDVVRDIEIRDKRDTMRANSPLVKGDDAIFIDTTHLTIKDVLDRITREIKGITKE